MGRARWVFKRKSDGQEVEVLTNLKIGRADDSGLKLTAPGASSRHAELTLDGADLYVTDLGSANGTFLNDRKLEPQVRTQVRLGDRIRFDIEEFEATLIGVTDTIQEPLRTPAATANYLSDELHGDAKSLAALLKNRPPAAARMVADDAQCATSTPYLYVASGKRAEQRILLAGEQSGISVWTIGSRADQTIKFDDDGVSPIHAKLSNDGQRWTLTDAISSARGTLVNGRRVSMAWVTSGDRLKFGPVECVLHLPKVVSGSGVSTRTLRNPDLQTVFAGRLKPAGGAPGLTAPRPLNADFKYSVTAPRSVRAGESFLLEVWAHLVADTWDVIARAIESSIDRDIVIRSVASKEAPAGSIIDVQVLIPAFGIDQKESIRWSDTIGNAGFLISVPVGSHSKPHSGLAKLFVGDFNIGLLEFEILVSDQHLSPAEVTRTAKRVTSGFASYAEEDQDQVMARVQGILSAVPDLDLFLDVTALRQKPNWVIETKAEIASRDAFYLFWSKAASKSRSVEHEWRTAISVKGLDVISPVPLVDPAELFPPAELAAIPFRRWVVPKHKPAVTKKLGSDVLPVDYVLGKYRITGLISQGGFGITYKARDETLQRDVAVKEYFPQSYAYRGADLSVQPLADSEDLFKWGLQRFLEEARALARFQHSHILRVYDHFEENSTAYLGMNLEVGRTLESIVCAEGIMNERRLRDDILMPLLDGLAEVHASGLLHRDIKPENIIVRDSDGKAVLIDFGASRLATKPSVDGNVHRLTSVISRGYSPIEQCAGREQGPFSDIYALSATLYRVITGNPPPDAVSRLHGGDLLTGVELAKKRCSTGLIEAMLAGLRMEPSDRPQSVAAFRALLENRTTIPRRLKWSRPSRPVLIGIIAFVIASLSIWIVLAWVPGS